MADVARRSTIGTDRLLDSLRGEWGVGLRTAARWDDLSEYEQMVFIETWAIPRGYHRILRERVGACELSPSQRVQFDDLCCWIENTRSAIEAVLEDSAL